jgi:hypothetical protein
MSVAECLGVRRRLTERQHRRAASELTTKADLIKAIKKAQK